MAAIPSSTSAAATASSVVAISITSTFLPPPECTQNSLSMLEDQQYFIWLNAPVPVPQSTVSSCYPAQFMSSFLQSVAGTSQPAFSPLVCPENYVTALNSGSYIACCPSDYKIALPTTAPPSDRPAFGGTCYSDITLGQTVTVTTYDNSTLLATSTWSPTTSGAQAYAYPMDGIASNETSTTASSTFATSISTSTSNSSTIAPTASSNSSSGISTKDRNIGIGVGVSFGCVALGLLTYFLWRWREQKQRPAELEEHREFDQKSELPGASPAKEASVTHEIGTNEPVPGEMPAIEMPVELPTHSD